MDPPRNTWRRAAARLTILLGALALGACSVADDGPRVTQARQVAPFVRVVNDSSVVLRLHVGEPRRVRIRAGAKVIDDVRTDVRDGTLHVTFDHDGFGHTHVLLDISVPRLTGIASQGSGDVAATNIETERFDVRSDGSGDIEVGGAAGRVTVRSDGSGSIDLLDLPARRVDLETDGSGDVAVRADKHLEVRLDGSGDVRYAGDPQLSQLDDGSGEIERVD